MNYNEIITEFDTEISNYIVKLKEKLEDLFFDTSKSKKFIISNDLEGKTLFENEKKQGVYLFELNLDNSNLKGKRRFTKIKNFSKDWAKKKNDSFFSSSVIQKRLKLKENFDEKWLPVYIGKNKDIYKRIGEHIDLSPKKNTYAMKLKHRTNLHGLEFRVSIIEVDVVNYSFIVPHIERSLRDKYQPIIGKQ